jgi:phenylalanyl-tRNA synthetase alpha chain
MTNLPVEHIVLDSLEKGKEHILHSLVEKTGLSSDSIRRIVGGLEEKGLIKVVREKVADWVLTQSGKKAVQQGYLPEEYIYGILVTVKHLLLEQLLKKFTLLAVKHGSTETEASKEFAAAFGLCKRKGFIQRIQNGGFALTPLGEKGLNNSSEKKVLEAIARGEIPPLNSPIVSELSARGLIAQKMRTNEIVQLTEKGVEEKKRGKTSASIQREVGPITLSLLASGEWKKVSFKPYDVATGVETRYPGRIHPLRQTIRDVRKSMVELGFREMEGPLVESAFWNMDAMFIPQDHPAREVQDTFYLPGMAVLPDADLVKRVKAIHEHGGKTGSRGFGYEWDPKMAMQMLLRTHTTATTFRELGKGLHPPEKRFSIGRIYRNEAMDATHLSEFYQVEGFVAGKGLTLRHLMGIVKEFCGKWGLTQIKFKPTYNPYTEPSMEALAYHPGLKRWVEIINSGMFRAESLKPFGIDVPIIAWGFGLERLAVLLHQKNTLREILGPDVSLDFIRNYPGITHTLMEKGGK